MKIWIKIGLVMVVWGANAQVSQNYFLRNPVRRFDTWTANLKPLADWWVLAQQLEEKRSGDPMMPKKYLPPERPLKAWVRITGNKEGEALGGWLMTATIEEAPGKKPRTERILLLHPPINEEQRFSSLIAERNELHGIRETSRVVAQGAQSHGQALASKADTLDTVRFASPYLNQELQPAALDYSRAAGAAFHKSQTAYKQMNNADGRMEVIRQELKSYPPGVVYQVDYLAIKTAATYQGLAVYDLGRF